MRTVITTAMLVIMAMLTGCPGTRAPGDPFGIRRPEELMNVCHSDGEAPAGRTMTFNRSKAKWHLREHQFDLPGACYALPSSLLPTTSTPTS